MDTQYSALRTQYFFVGETKAWNVPLLPAPGGF
jgi:hypothetical protein